MEPTRHEDSAETTAPLAGRRVRLVGRLAGMTRRETVRRIRAAGGQVAEQPEDPADLVVLPDDWAGEAATAHLAAAANGPAIDPTAEVIGEAELWRRLGVVSADGDVQRRYTAAMLAEVVGQPVNLIRRWQRRGLLQPVEIVHRLAYFDFAEVTVGRRLAQLAGAGLAPEAIARRVEALGQLLPGVARPLADPAVVIEGRTLTVRQPDGLLEAGGQLRFDFEAGDPGRGDAPAPRLLVFGPLTGTAPGEAPPSVEELVQLAGEFDDHGRLAEAAEAYRAALSAGGANAEINFLLAEVLFRLGDLPAARERYYVTLELDEGFVEARANLGCVLAEQGDLELAEAALEGALARHGEYPDAHFHLARLLDDQQRPDEALPHWLTFLELSPESPWADLARQRTAGCG